MTSVETSSGDSYSAGIQLRELEQIAKSHRNGGEDIVDTYYGWRDARALTVAKGMGAASLSLLTAWLIPFLKNEYADASTWLIVVTPAAIVCTLAVIGAMSLMRMDLIHGSYIRAMVWLQRSR